jgi:hypothetical protein
MRLSKTTCALAAALAIAATGAFAQVDSQPTGNMTSPDGSQGLEASPSEIVPPYVNTTELGAGPAVVTTTTPVRATMVMGPAAGSVVVPPGAERRADYQRWLRLR